VQQPPHWSPAGRRRLPIRILGRSQVDRYSLCRFTIVGVDDRNLQAAQVGWLSVRISGCLELFLHLLNELLQHLCKAVMASASSSHYCVYIRLHWAVEFSRANFANLANFTSTRITITSPSFLALPEKTANLFQHHSFQLPIVDKFIVSFSSLVSLLFVRDICRFMNVL